jgi:DNA-binding beta-propeller fold protein YncE
VEDCSSAADDDCNGFLNDRCPLWSTSFGGAFDQAASDIAGDTEGHVVIGGALEGSASFGGDLLTSAGGRDAFLVKLTRNGNHLWSRRFGDGEDQSARAVAIDSGGNVIIAGVFRGAINLGEALNGKHTSLGQDDIFVAKLSPGGDFMWSRRFGGASSNVVHSVAVDAAGDIAVAGDFSGVMEVSGASSLTSAGMLDGFVAKLSPFGALLWAKSYGGPGDDSCQSAAVSANGDIHLAGYFAETVDFGGGALASGGGADAFVAKLTPFGGHIWSKSTKLALAQKARSIAVDAQGNAVVLGVFNGAIDFGGPPAVGDGSEDLFVTKLSPAGSLLWTARFGGPADEEPGGVAVNAAGEVFLVAMLDGAADFGGGVITSAGNDDVVVVKLTANGGAHIWSRRFGSFADQDGRALLPLATGGAFVVGDFAGKIDFGGGELTSAGGRDVFLAELPP